MRFFAKTHDFEESVKPELPVLLRVAQRLTICDDDANELVQRCLIKAFRGWRGFDGRYLRGWLIQILRRENAMKLRHERAMPKEVELDPDAAEGDGFWNEVEWRDEAHRILEVLQTLPEEFRLTVHLCDVEELTYEEIARALEVPVGTVRSRVHRGRRMIRRRLWMNQGGRDAAI